MVDRSIAVAIWDVPLELVREVSSTGPIAKTTHVECRSAARHVGDGLFVRAIKSVPGDEKTAEMIEGKDKVGAVGVGEKNFRLQSSTDQVSLDAPLLKIESVTQLRAQSSLEDQMLQRNTFTNNFQNSV